MTVPRVALAAVAPQPWKNGGGSTRELLAWPRAEGWAVRVSVATIDANGPFSPYPGVTRWFAVLHGAGVRLEFAGSAAIRTPSEAPLLFDGADAPWCELLDGTTTDLNLMLRGSGGAMHRAAPGSAPDAGARWRALYAAAPARLDIGSATIDLPAGTLAWSDDPAPLRWTLLDGAHAFWLEAR
jgi:environmental stress-induced protein Ves